MKLLMSIKLFLLTICSVFCIEAFNETLLSNEENDSSLTTASNDVFLNISLTTNTSDSEIAQNFNNSSNSLLNSTDIHLNETHISDTHVISDSLSEKPIEANKTSENNSQENLSSKNCFESVCSETAPKVLVTHKSQTSISIAFDDFKLPNYESGYVVQYKQQDLNDTEWIQIQANNTPFVTIKNLRPHTTYDIRVLVWEDIESKKLGSGSEIISVTTEDEISIQIIISFESKS